MANNLCPAWGEQSLTDRLQTCRIMLVLHGCLTDGESARVEARIKRQGPKRKARETEGGERK